MAKEKTMGVATIGGLAKELGEETAVILGVAMGAEVPVLLAGTTYVVDSAGADLIRQRVRGAPFPQGRRISPKVKYPPPPEDERSTDAGSPSPRPSRLVSP